MGVVTDGHMIAIPCLTVMALAYTVVKCFMRPIELLGEKDSGNDGSPTTTLTTLLSS